MSDYDFDDDNAGPGDLRKALEKAKAALAAKEKELEAERTARADAEKKAKASTLRDVLSGLKVDPKFARLAERDGVEADEASVKKWIDENKDFYNFTPSAPKADEPEPERVEQEDEFDPDYANAIEAAGRVAAGSAGMGSSSVIDQIADLDAGSYEELVQKLADLGAPLG